MQETSKQINFFFQMSSKKFFVQNIVNMLVSDIKLFIKKWKYSYEQYNILAIRVVGDSVSLGEPGKFEKNTLNFSIRWYSEKYNFALFLSNIEIFFSTGLGWPTIMFLIFWDFLMDEQICLSPEVKRSVIISYKLVHTTYLTSCQTT